MAPDPHCFCRGTQTLERQGKLQTCRNGNSGHFRRVFGFVDAAGGTAVADRKGLLPGRASVAAAERRGVDPINILEAAIRLKLVH